jgi:hypothetical protein
MAAHPTLTPHQANALLRVDGDFTHRGFVYMLDGPCGTPTEHLYPVAIPLEDDSVGFFPQGEVHDPITAETKWFKLS